jgi:hypothetical protein
VTGLRPLLGPTSSFSWSYDKLTASAYLSFPLPGAASTLTDIVTPLRCVTLSFHGVTISLLPPFIFRQRFIASSSFDNASFVRLPSQTKTEALNSYHHHQSFSPDCLTPTLHCYKNVISILTTLPTAQPYLYFASYVAKTPCHQNSTSHHGSLSLSFYAHRPSA